MKKSINSPSLGSSSSIKFVFVRHSIHPSRNSNKPIDELNVPVFFFRLHVSSNTIFFIRAYANAPPSSLDDAPGSTRYVCDRCSGASRRNPSACGKIIGWTPGTELATGPLTESNSSDYSTLFYSVLSCWRIK